LILTPGFSKKRSVTLCTYFELTMIAEVSLIQIFTKRFIAWAISLSYSNFPGAKREAELEQMRKLDSQDSDPQ